MNIETNNHPVLLALMLSAFSALGPFTVDMYLSSLPQMMNDFGTNASMIQMSLTSSLLGLGLGQLVTGPLSDVYGRRKPLLISMLLYLLASMACAFSPIIGIFIALRFIQGFVASAGLVISRAIVRDRYSGVEMVKFIALLTMISNVAPLISPTAGSAVSTFASWIGVFIFLGLLGLFLTAMTVWGIKESLPAEVLFALNGLGIILGSQFVKRLAGRMDERRIFRIGLQLACVTTAAILIVVLSHGPFYPLFISIFLFAASIGIVGPVSFTLAMESQGHIAGSAAAVLGTLQFALGAVTSPLVGIAGENSALPFGVTIFMTSILAVISYLFLVKRPASALK
jgi:DHA1 family bicyclomycin/chloramphenicol resistance-like MFS transporter